MDLLPKEIRALGCLIEKQRTTPDAYPLTLNSLRLACNQSTNRDPVVAYDEGEVRDALRRLERRGFVRFASGAGSRAAKYRHLLAERLPMDDSEQALLCVLMLRGAQTPGELKQRAERMHAFASLNDVEETLERLIGRGLVARLSRRPGQKEERYGQLLGVDAAPEGASVAVAPDVLERRDYVREAGVAAAPDEPQHRDYAREAGVAAVPGEPERRDYVREPGATVAGLGAESAGEVPDEGERAEVGVRFNSERAGGAVSDVANGEDAVAGTLALSASESALAAEVRSLRDRVLRLEGGLAEIRAELGIEA